MTAIITLENNNTLKSVTITKDDIDRLKKTSSRLPIGTTLTKDQALLIMLQSSENRAASALLRNYPGGFVAGIAAMNKKALEIGMLHTKFVDSNGLNPHNVSTAADLAKLVEYASKNAKIRQFSTSKHTKIGRLHYINSNYLVRQGKMPIITQKTGFINEAGYCVVMKMVINETPYTMVFMGSKNKNGRFSDALDARSFILKTKLPKR
jgi:D-alanyl-D-alanine endopeptidase (penicillin-binding protein 7)